MATWAAEWEGVQHDVLLLKTAIERAEQKLEAEKGKGPAPAVGARSSASGIYDSNAWVGSQLDAATRHEAQRPRFVSSRRVAEARLDMCMDICMSMCMGHVYGTCVWDMCMSMCMGHVYGTCVWDMCMGHVYRHVYGTCI